MQSYKVHIKQSNGRTHLPAGGRGGGVSVKGKEGEVRVGVSEPTAITSDQTKQLF